MKITVPPPPAPTFEQMQKLFTPDQLKEISAALAQNTPSTSTSGGAQPQPPSINHLSDGGEDDHDDSYDEEFPTFQKAPPKMTWPVPKKTNHSVNVLSVNKFNVLSSDEASEDSDQPDYPPLLSDGHSDDFSQPEASKHARQRFISAEKRVQRRLQKQQRKARGRQEDLSWYDPVRPLRPAMKTKSTQTVETRETKLPKPEKFLPTVPNGENPSSDHENSSTAATDEILDTGEVKTSSIVELEHFTDSKSPPEPSPTTSSTANPNEDATSADALLVAPEQLIAATDTSPPPSSTPRADDFSDLLPADFWKLKTTSTAPISTKTLRRTTSCHVAPACTTWHSRQSVEDESPDVFILTGLVLCLGLASRSATDKLHRRPPWDPLETPSGPPRGKDDIITFCGELPQSTRTSDQPISTSDLPHPPSTIPKPTYAFMVRAGSATTTMPLMGDYFAANLNSKQPNKAVAKVHFPTITPAAVLDTMAKPIPAEDATPTYTPTSIEHLRPFAL